MADLSVTVRRSLGRSEIAPSLSTASFASDENPIAAGAAWKHGGTDGLDWQNIRVVSGRAYGTQSGSSGLYDDSVAILTGAWNPDQQVDATVSSTNPNSTAFCEVELWVRASVTPHGITGIETNFRCTADGSQYIGVVRWNGPLGNFSQYGSNDVGPGMHTGDRIRVTVIGDLHRVYVAPAADPTNYSLVTTHDLTSLGGLVCRSGNPGLGHWYRINGAVGTAVSDHALTAFSARTL